MEVYIVEAFSAEPYDSSTWVDSVFKSLESAQEYVKQSRDANDRPVEMGFDDCKYFISSYITTMELKD